jgi:hypothetical protein
MKGASADECLLCAVRFNNKMQKFVPQRPRLGELRTVKARPPRDRPRSSFVCPIAFASGAAYDAAAYGLRSILRRRHTKRRLLGAKLGDQRRSISPISPANVRDWCWSLNFSRPATNRSGQSHNDRGEFQYRWRAFQAGMCKVGFCCAVAPGLAIGRAPIRSSVSWLPAGSRCAALRMPAGW